MLNSIERIKGSTIAAVDGEIGHVRQAYFDDSAWVIRWLVVDTGGWLSGRSVLVSPYAVTQPVGSGKLIDVSLTLEQVRTSPDVDTHLPVSRRLEREYLRHNAYPDYWEGGGLWSSGALPMLPPQLLVDLPPGAANPELPEPPVPPEDVHLRSTAAVTGYRIQASDDSIGHVSDFVFDDESWAIRYLVVDTRNWWPGGAHVLIATPWIDRIDWSEETVHVTLTRQQVKDSPAYDATTSIKREYEKRLHEVYSRVGYWD
jgi:hypothetical protein